MATKRKDPPSSAEIPAKKKPGQVTDGIEDTPKRGRGRPRKDIVEPDNPISKQKFGRPANGANPESKFKSRKSAVEMIEEYAANLMDDLKNKLLEGDEKYDSEDDEEEPDPLKLSSGKRSNRSGSVSGRSNQDEGESDVEKSGYGLGTQ